MKKLITLVILAGLITGWFLLVPTGKDYWKNIGPAWDKILNPETAAPTSDSSDKELIDG